MHTHYMDTCVYTHTHTHTFKQYVQEWNSHVCMCFCVCVFVCYCVCVCLFERERERDVCVCVATAITKPLPRSHSRLDCVCVRACVSDYKNEQTFIQAYIPYTNTTHTHTHRDVLSAPCSDASCRKQCVPLGPQVTLFDITRHSNHLSSPYLPQLTLFQPTSP
jgi:hypothetical protein